MPNIPFDKQADILEEILSGIPDLEQMQRIHSDYKHPDEPYAYFEAQTLGIMMRWMVEMLEPVPHGKDAITELLAHLRLKATRP